MRRASIFKRVKRAGLAVEAIICLFIARATLRLLPVRLIFPYFGSETASQENDASRLWVTAWIAAWASYVPWRAKCLEQAIASKLMLRRRGLASILYLGVKKENGRFIAHAWLKGENPASFEPILLPEGEKSR